MGLPQGMAVGMEGGGVLWSVMKDWEVHEGLLEFEVNDESYWETLASVSGTHLVALHGDAYAGVAADTLALAGVLFGHCQLPLLLHKLGQQL